jgi:hypothetical protein
MAAIKAKVNRDTLKMIVYEGEGMVVCNNLIIIVRFVWLPPYD